MILKKKNVFAVLFLFAIFPIKAQDCPHIEPGAVERELSEIDGETMGQKLESLLFWTQDEKERRFPIMQDLFPSITVPIGQNILSLQAYKPLVPRWDDETTVRSYMTDNRIGGVIVLQDGKIRLEEYAEGVDRKTVWTSFSVAKSVSSMLLGIALKEGAINSMEDILGKYIHELQGHDYGQVSVRQLLTMTSGIEWNEDYADPQSDVAQMYLGQCVDDEAHILTYMKDLKFKYEPGTHWNYSTGETDLVGILIQKATGKSLAEYLSEKIWKPFGMEQCAYWLADECSNLNLGGSGLSASLRDFARLGLFMLDQGRINGQCILAEQWLKDATAVLYKTNDQGEGYGYLWWRFKDGSFAAVGIFGQMLYIDPAKDLVIAQVAAWPLASSHDLAKARRRFIDAVQRAATGN